MANETELLRCNVLLSRELVTVLDIVAEEREISRAELIEQLCWFDPAVEQHAMDRDLKVNPMRPPRGRRWA
jgi:hypothetical protein